MTTVYAALLVIALIGAVVLLGGLLAWLDVRYGPDTDRHEDPFTVARDEDFRLAVGTDAILHTLTQEGQELLREERQ